ncbi:MAG: FliH/SctL family protein [Pseudobdellovibrionaceae bacterium]
MFKSIISKEQSKNGVLEFSPPKLDRKTPEAAFQYLKKIEEGCDFHMADVIKTSTGVKEIELANVEAKVQELALAHLKEIQEKAYAEAYQLGLDEGRKEAFEKQSGEIDHRLSQIDQFLANAAELKTQLVAHNEAHIVKLVFDIAKRVALKEITQDKESILAIIKNAISMSQGDEQITIEVAPEQLEFLESLKKESRRDLEGLKKIKFEASPDVKPGGCIIKTNYGEIDARVDERVEKLWSSLIEITPKVESEIKSA